MVKFTGAVSLVQLLSLTNITFFRFYVITLFSDKLLYQGHLKHLELSNLNETFDGNVGIF